uniref:Uncharacterized protein n=1 Tax=Arundo donax TaxID=35708 RepID=A0A0A9A0R9_ARUDO
MRNELFLFSAASIHCRHRCDKIIFCSLQLQLPFQYIGI